MGSVVGGREVLWCVCGIAGWGFRVMALFMQTLSTDLLSVDVYPSLNNLLRSYRYFLDPIGRQRHQGFNSRCIHRAHVDRSSPTAGSVINSPSIKM